MPLSVAYADALIAGEMARIRAMMGLVPYPLKISALEGLAERCTSALKEGVATLESLRRNLRAGGDVGTVMESMSSCIENVLDIEEYGLPPLQCQTREMALINAVLHRLHAEMKLPIPCPTACCISNRHYASHMPTNTIYTPIGESRSVQHFAHLYHELGHYLLRALDDPRLAPLRDGYGRATDTIDAHYACLALDGEEKRGPAYATDYVEWARAQWGEWLIESFCDLFGVFGGGPASAWAYLHMVAKRRPPVYGLGALVPQTHPPSDARMEMMCAGLRLSGFSSDADAIWATWRDMAVTVGGSPGAMYRHAVPEGPLRNVVRIIHESLGDAGIALYDPGSQGQAGSPTRALLNDAWDVFWRLRPEEFQEWEAAAIGRFDGPA